MRTHLFRPKLLVALVAGAALAIAGSIAWASIPDAGGVFHGCVNKNSGVLRLIDTELGQTCNPNESAVSWNQTGPQGPPGLSGYELVVGDPVIIDQSNLLGIAVATCPSGKKVLGGGWGITGQSNPVSWEIQGWGYPGGDEYEVAIALTSPTGSLTIVATAICASVSP